MNPRHIGAVSPNSVVRSLQLPTFTEATGRNWFQLILLHSKMKLVHIWTLKKSPVYLSGGYETAVFPFANTYVWPDMDFPSSCLHLTNTPSFLQPSDFIHCNYELLALPIYPTLLKFYHFPLCRSKILAYPMNVMCYHSRNLRVSSPVSSQTTIFKDKLKTSSVCLKFPCCIEIN